MFAGDHRKIKHDAEMKEASASLLKDLEAVHRTLRFDIGVIFGIACVSGELDIAELKLLHGVAREVARATEIYLHFDRFEDSTGTVNLAPETLFDGMDLQPELSQLFPSPPQIEQ